ncbi:P-loop containing nucleoside triphosphate hydrolase protein [Cladorrhinum samala]|uniref:DNA 3'-5' helicase n=1 Tax=Cladorrhinum samala TaxID=585594 RepID=A0AAV9HP74_9PEZI|nr:P-loop containing nucleoside triphosphate hydrolase protein [Cladorrhinum samala]
MPPPLLSSQKAAILSSLNDAQRRAVTSDAPTVAILAGPGSGKTHTLTSRVVWLVDHVGIRPEDVIVATFTVKAAREMKERIGKALGNGREKKIVLGNFHSIARRYLAAYGRHIGLNQKFGIADDADSRAIIKRICNRKPVQPDPAAVRAWISKKKAKGTEVDKKNARKDAAKNKGLQDLEECYQEYQSHLEKSNLLDFDDLLVKCVELLQKFPSCVSNIQTVLIDEYQDTNGIQYELMKLFAQRHKRITIVGDPDQSIYGWRSAEVKNLWRFLADFRATAEISLEENYRSFRSILDLSLLVIQQDKNRYKKMLKPIHNRGPRPVLRKLKSASAEGDWIVSEIKRVMMMSGGMLTNNDVAVLLRSASLSRHIESALGKAGVAYKMIGGFKFYDRVEIKVIIDYLRVIYQPENNDALGRIMNVPKRGIGEGTIQKLHEEARQASISVWALLSKHSRGERTAKTRIAAPMEQKIVTTLLRPLDIIRKKIGESAGPGGTPFGLVEVIEQLLSSIEFQKHMQLTYPDDHEQRWANVQELVSLAADFVRDLAQSGEDDILPEIEGLEQAKETEVLPRFLANVSLAADAQTGDKDEESKPVVTISTIHAAKGLEWPIVFVPAVYNGSIPHLRAEDNDEERRLLYVAMTRAQNLLYLSCPVFCSDGKEDGPPSRNQLSPFIEPINRAFANKGPCLDRPVMSEIAKVLGRKLPSEDDIFRELPTMFSIEDNIFPVDPEQKQTDSTNEAPRAAKRPRLSGPGHQTNGEEIPWKKEYVTTMEQSTAFTASALPGFVSASTHQARIAAEAAVNEALKAAEKAEKLKKMTASKRPLDQTSILGFVKTASSSSSSQLLPTSNKPRAATTKTGYSQFSFPRSSTSTQPKPALEPELASHKLPTGKAIINRPARPAREEEVKKKQYPAFSSSPQRAPPAEEELEDVDEEPPEPTRAAACMHTTTFTSLPHTGFNRGVKRPPGLRREGEIAPLDKLRKPFRPLTMNKGR